jgi:hypothetical protein
MKRFLTVTVMTLLLGGLVGGQEPKYPLGRTFPAGDGCNTCIEQANGVTSCTLAFCRPWQDRLIGQEPKPCSCSGDAETCRRACNPTYEETHIAQLEQRIAALEARIKELGEGTVKVKESKAKTAKELGLAVEKALTALGDERKRVTLVYAGYNDVGNPVIKIDLSLTEMESQ